MNSSPDSTDNKKLPSTPPVSEVNSKFIDAASTVRTASSSEKFNSSAEKLITPTVPAQKPPLSPIPVAPAINIASTHRPIHIPDPFDIEPLFPLPPPHFTEIVARKSKSFKHRESIDAIFCDK